MLLTEAAYDLRYYWAAAGRTVHVFLFSSGDGKQVNSKMETHNTPRLFISEKIGQLRN